MHILILLGILVLLSPILGWLLLGIGLAVGLLAQILGGLAIIIIPAVIVYLVVKATKRK